jgi:signal transduction histidine kinase
LSNTLDRNRPYFAQRTAETQRPLLMESVSPETVVSFAQGDPERLRALRAIDPKSGITVPLMADGKAFGILALVSSASSRRLTAEDLRLAEALALRASLAIEKARLYRVAQRALQARDEVLGIVAHDLRNPLNAIVLEAELLRGLRAMQKPGFRDTVLSIERSAERMNRMIQDLLDVARIEAGRLVVERTRVSVSPLIWDAVQAQKPIAAAASVDLQLGVACDVPELWADRDRLLQVFDNLIGNALKFTPPGGCITVGAALNEGEVQLWVADTGVGIAAEDLPHVFDRFWQARKGERRGAGLGLPIVKGILEAHCGRIWVESALGMGTTFFFALRAADRTVGDSAGAA